MKINFSTFKDAFDMATKFSSNTPIGIMIAQRDGKTAVVYADNRQAVYKEIEAEVTEDEMSIGDIIFDYGYLTDAINKISPSGQVKVDNIEFDLSDIDNKIVTVKADKYIILTNGENNFKQTTTHIESKVRAFKPDVADNKYRTTSRFVYNARLFTYDVCDTWDSKALATILKRIGNGEDARGCYLLRKDKAGFIVNRSSVFYTKCDKYLENVSISINCKAAKSVVDILNKVGIDLVDVFNSEEKYCSIVAQDKSFGLWFAMADYNSQYGAELVQYKRSTEDVNVDREYNDVEILLNKDAILDMIKSYKVNNKKDTTTIKFDFNDTDASNNTRMIVENEDGSSEEESVDVKGNVALIIGDSNTDKVKYYAPAHRKNAEDETELTLVMSFPVWEEILNTCESTNVRLGVCKVTDKVNYLRFDDLSSELGDDGKPLVTTEMYTVATNKE